MYSKLFDILNTLRVERKKRQKSIILRKSFELTQTERKFQNCFIFPVISFFISFKMLKTLTLWDEVDKSKVILMNKDA